MQGRDMAVYKNVRPDDTLLLERLPCYALVWYIETLSPNPNEIKSGSIPEGRLTDLHHSWHRLAKYNHDSRHLPAHLSLFIIVVLLDTVEIMRRVL